MIRTIIVDDELLAGVGIRSLIDGNEDISVSEVFSEPEEAIEYLRENMVDVVITDIEMGEMSGLDFIKVIREEKLAPGVIILSCHADFSYAQEAIAQGTDSYLLKHSISADQLTKEIHKVSEKHQNDVRTTHVSAAHQEKKTTGREIYRVIILRLFSSSEGQHVETSMLVNLLDRLVSRYEMGTLIAPYNREMFLIMQSDRNIPQTKRLSDCKDNLSTLQNSILQYTGQKIRCGVSSEFTDLTKSREAYEESLKSLENAFYQPEQSVFFLQPERNVSVKFSYRDEQFLEEDGPDELERELKQYLFACSMNHTPVSRLRTVLSGRCQNLIAHNLQMHHFSDSLNEKWKDSPAVGDAILQAADISCLQTHLLAALSRFRQDCLRELDRDSLTDAFDYIEQHLAEKISLTELADISCMSVPTFSKKFKERTGVTLVNYLNDRRIERVMVLLQDKNLSLEQIAEETGFSNANYLIRVFKKSTGKTISEFRK